MPCVPLSLLPHFLSLFLFSWPSRVSLLSLFDYSAVDALLRHRSARHLFVPPRRNSSDPGTNSLEE
ncbi:hypothetical protein QJS10_CPA10g00520 [Acorus calamus]|uniref:Secreted protein n=1 Tax=Acorus calamus TaxID=4465 RepID=A0AAV9DZS0_ACOCL|nr:hypothetical protein QJS10_CPA10g00520 [Acorus calamus]